MGSSLFVVTPRTAKRRDHDAVTGPWSEDDAKGIRDGDRENGIESYIVRAHVRTIERMVVCRTCEEDNGRNRLRPRRRRA